MKRSIPPRIGAVSSWIGKLLVAALIVWWLCGGAFSTRGESESAGNSIRFSHFGTYHDYVLWREIIAEFEREHPGVTVHQEFITGLFGHYNTKMRQQILSSDLPDVALIQLGPFHELASHFANLGAFLENRTTAQRDLDTTLHTTGLSAFQVKGVQRGLPVSGGTLQIFANVACFERASRFHGFPVDLPTAEWTMEDFRKTAQLLTCDFDGDGRIDQFGFWLPRWIYYLPFLWSHGAKLTDDHMSKWELTGPAAEQALSFYRDLALDHRVCPRAEEVPQLFQDVGFLTGKVGMCVNGPWFMPFLADTSLADAYVVAPIPRGRGRSVTRATWDGIVMAANVSDDHRALAWSFIEYVLSERSQDRIARMGRAIPARIASAATFVSPRKSTRGPFVGALATARLQPLLQRFGEVDRDLNRHLRTWIDPTCTMSAKEFLSSIASDRIVRDVFPGRERP